MPEMSASAIFGAAFSTARTLRSAAYRKGVMNCLLQHCARGHASDLDTATSNAVCLGHTFKAGTASFDAYFAGVEEGHVLFRRAVARCEHS